MKAKLWRGGRNNELLVGVCQSGCRVLVRVRRRERISPSTSPLDLGLILNHANITRLGRRERNSRSTSQPDSGLILNHAKPQLIGRKTPRRRTIANPGSSTRAATPMTAAPRAPISDAVGSDQPPTRDLRLALRKKHTRNLPAVTLNLALQKLHNQGLRVGALNIQDHRHSLSDHPAKADFQGNHSHSLSRFPAAASRSRRNQPRQHGGLKAGMLGGRWLKRLGLVSSETILTSWMIRNRLALASRTDAISMCLKVPMRVREVVGMSEMSERFARDIGTSEGLNREVAVDE